jgi:haloalkane dehalogenase
MSASLITEGAAPDWLAPHRDLYPFATKTAQVRGRAMSYVDLAPAPAEGVVADRPATVMVHGNPTWSFYYRDVLRAVSASGGRALAPDHIGCGLSEKPSASDYQYTLSERVADLEEWMNVVGLDESPINLVVHDWGGMIGCAYATRYPERINKLVVLNTAAFHIPGDKRLPFTLALGRNTRLGQVLIQGFNAFSGLATRWACMRPLSGAVRKAYTAPYHSWSTRVATHRFVKDIPLKPTDDAYQVVSETQARLTLLKDKPIFVGWGLKDFVFDETFLRVWLARFPEAEQHIYPEGGHYILEDARDDLIPKIVEFLSPVSA